MGARDGLHFLGHWIYARGIVIDSATEQRLIDRFTTSNAASYQALHLPRNLRKQLPWILQQEIEKTLDVNQEIL